MRQAYVVYTPISNSIVVAYSFLLPRHFLSGLVSRLNFTVKEEGGKEYLS